MLRRENLARRLSEGSLLRPSAPKFRRRALQNFAAVDTETNQQPKPFVWTADPDNIIAAVRRGHQTLDLLH
jgi:hypothetical protein